MSVRGPYRRHSLQFNLQICTDIRNGKLGRREAVKTHNLSANLMQLWLTQFDRGEFDLEEAAASTVAEYEARLLRCSARLVSSRWSSISLKKHRDYDSSPTSRHHRSSTARNLLYSMGMPSDRPSSQHLLLPSKIFRSSYQ
jgi:transposase-like protein